MHSGHVRVDYKRWWEEIMGNNPSPGTTAFPFLPSNSSYPFPDGDPSIPITPIIPTQVTTPGPATSATIKIGEVELILEGFFSGVGGCFFIALMVFGIILM